MFTTVSVAAQARSAQNIVVPFGGGAVAAVTIRALFDDELVYFNLEWDDPAPDDAVNAGDLFSDAAALQFPGFEGATPPYTMGAAGQPVNIWQWKAVWQRDIDDGFTDSSDRYPNTYADFYSITGGFPDAPAADVGNPLSQATHASPIENAIAEGFGTLTTSTAQDVQGSGEWRDGRWRVVFARALAPSTEGLASFALDTPTQVALAVWDGGSGDRNGQKSIAQFIDVQIGSAGSDTTPPTVVWVGMLVMIGAVITATAAVAIADRSRGRDR